MHSLPAASCGPGVDQDQGQLIARILPTAVDGTAIANRIEIDIWIPETIPILPLAARAPPSRG
jgi:hypothetical protein